MTTTYAVAGAALAAAAAWPGWRWVRAGGHRREGDEGPLPRATWLVPLAALVGGALAGTWSDQPALAVVLVLASVVLLLLCAVDLDVHRLPDVLTGPAFVGVLLGLLVVALATGAWGTWRRAVLAALVLGLVYLVLVIAGRGQGMGLGDLKLAPTLGLLMGAHSWSAVLTGTMAAFLLGGVAALWLLLARGASRDTHLAFGPAMVGGALVALLLPGSTLLW